MERDLQCNPSEKQKEQCQNARKSVKIAVKDANKAWLQSEADKISMMNFQPLRAWNAIKKITNGLQGHHKKAVKAQLQQTNGILATSDEENCEAIRAHFEKKYLAGSQHLNKKLLNPSNNGTSIQTWAIPLQ